MILKFLGVVSSLFEGFSLCLAHLAKPKLPACIGFQLLRLIKQTNWHLSGLCMLAQPMDVHHIRIAVNDEIPNLHGARLPFRYELLSNIFHYYITFGVIFQ